uniref:Epoxide hydrolase n=1 Tax=Tanacetum cinerariifolium TaxID=118510 RepID=A0A699HMQ1_TANCI|nr:epoxide hydrolase [Tanacetum cinerariifolium]
MALKQQIIERLNEEIDADRKTINRITTLLRELLVNGDQREESIEEILKLSLTGLHQYAHLYLVLLNEKDCKKMTKLTYADEYESTHESENGHAQGNHRNVNKTLVKTFCFEL